MGRWKGEQRGTLSVVGGAYYGRWREWVECADGKLEWKQVKRKLCDKAEGRGRAIEILNENVQQAGAPSACHQGTATLQQFVDARFRPDHVAHLKPNGQRFYEEQLRPILAALGGYRMKEFHQGMIQAFLNAQSKGRSAQTVRHRRNVLSAIFRHAKACGYWRGDLPTEYVRTPEVHPAVKGALSEAQVKALLLATPEPYRTLVLLMVSTGLRIGEALGLRWDCVDLDARTIDVIRSYTGYAWTDVKSRASRRRLPLSEECAMALEALRVPGPHGWLVFANRFGRPWDASNIAEDKLKVACKNAALPRIGWHVLRHTALTLMQARGLAGPDAQLMAGHGSQAVTAIYTHADGQQMRGVVDGFKFLTTETGRIM